jgi:hypothetical protein
MSLTLPPPQHYQESAYSGYGYPQQGLLTSPYQTPGGHPIPTLSSGGSGSNAMSEYFPPFPGPPHHSHPPPSAQAYASPSWTSGPLRPPSQAPARAGGGGGSGAKTSRQQFTACGACRHRRVKCDLKEKQDALERETREDEERGVGPVRASVRRKKAICTNCEERGTNCVYVTFSSSLDTLVILLGEAISETRRTPPSHISPLTLIFRDEYAPLKAAKQLRRGKRISEIEMLYGKTAASAAVAANPDEGDEGSRSPKGKDRIEFIPELTKEFFDSPFFRRFQIQSESSGPFSSTCPLLHVVWQMAVSVG